MKRNIHGFTLVEVIIVVAILIALGTIAFISTQGYTADARNAKRVQDVANIEKMILGKSVEGMSMMNFVKGNLNRAPSFLVSLGGKTGSSIPLEMYTAGFINYDILGVLERQFSDPLLMRGYRIGITSTGGERYEIATGIEHGSSSRQAYVKGNYVPRFAISVAGVASGNTFTLTSDSDTGRFKLQDTVISPSGQRTIINVSNSNKEFILDDTAGATLTLGATEMSSLLIDPISPMHFVTGGGQYLADR